MVIENVYFKRDAVLHARVPEEIKRAFMELAERKDKSASEYVLELVLRELRCETQNAIQTALNHQKNDDHGK